MTLTSAKIEALNLLWTVKGLFEIRYMRQIRALFRKVIRFSNFTRRSEQAQDFPFFLVFQKLFVQPILCKPEKKLFNIKAFVIYVTVVFQAFLLTAIEAALRCMETVTQTIVLFIPFSPQFSTRNCADFSKRID